MLGGRPDFDRSSERESVPQKAYIGLGVIIENEFGEILMGLRNGESGFGLWSIPGGRLEVADNGDLRYLGIRETLEEAGIDLTPYEIEMVSADYSFIPKSGFMNFGLYTKVRGRPEASIPSPHEYSEWRWIPKSDVEKMVEEDGLIFEPPRISLLCYFKQEILYPFNEEKSKED